MQFLLLWKFISKSKWHDKKKKYKHFFMDDRWEDILYK